MTKKDNTSSLSLELLAEFTSIVGERYALTQAEDQRSFLVE